MAYVQPRNSATITVPAGQSIRIGNPRGLPLQLLAISPNRVNGPIIDVPASNITYGPYTAATDLLLVNNGYDVIEYQVAASPVLTDAPFAPAAVAITGGTMSGVAITTGSINNTPIGATTRSTAAVTTLSQTTTDQTGTPGNVTNNNGMGRAAFAAAGSTVVVTNSSVAAADTVIVQLLGAADATLTIVNVTVAAGSFTVTGNAAATATKSFMWHVIKA